MDFINLYSDDDEEIVEYLSRPMLPRQVFPRSDLFITLSDDKFRRRFRLCKTTCVILLQEIESQLKYNIDRSTSVAPMNQLLCTLRFLATGSQLITCGDIIGVHESTACRIVHRVIHCIASLYKKYIKLPSTPEEQNQLALDFYKIAKFPRVNGAIDCTHVRIISPGGENAEIFRNRKGYFSINTQCVTGPNMMFLDVVARWHGSAHDSNIWDNCALKRYFLHGKFNNKVLLGDSGYAQTNYMMTPLSDERINTRGERLYQESQIKTRNVIERTFGVWKKRFPILSRGINMNIKRVPGIIVAAAVLHNIAILHKDEVPNVTPLSDERINTRGERLYQESQIKTRNVIERTFGVWKKRFPILSRGINMNIKRVPGIIVAAAVLHNIAILHKDEVPNVEIEYPVILENEIQLNNQQSRNSNNLQRRLLIEYFNSI